MNDVELIDALLEIRCQAVELATAHENDLGLVPAMDRSSARNLLHYVGLRQFDVRDVQRELAWRGLSSLGRSEAHVLASLDAVLSRLGVSCETDDDAPSFASSRDSMIRHTDEVLGAARRSDVRLMVTLPCEAASDAVFVGGLVAAGMDIARVNCAHDDAETWKLMVAQLRAHTPRPRVAFDLAGPKLRTGDLPAGPRVVKVRPRRGADGIVQRPGRLLLVDPDRTIESEIDSRLVVVPVNGPLLSDVAIGDDIVLRDTRERRRALAVVKVDAQGVEAICERTAYLATGLELECRREGLTIGRSEVGELPESDSFIRLETRS